MSRTRVSREANDAIRFQAVEMGLACDAERPFRFHCECGEADCRRTAELTLKQYAGVRIVPGWRVLSEKCRLREESCASIAKSHLLRAASRRKRDRLARLRDARENR